MNKISMKNNEDVRVCRKEPEVLAWLERFKAAQHGYVEIVGEKKSLVEKYSTYNHFVTIIPRAENALGFKLRYEESYGIFILELLLSEMIPGSQPLLFAADYLRDDDQEEVLNEIAAGRVIVNEYVFGQKSYYQGLFPKLGIKFSNAGILKEFKMRRTASTKTHKFSAYK